MTMTEERRGQIALLLLKRDVRRNPVRVGPPLVRELGDVAKDIEVPVEELLEFSQVMIHEVLDETFKTSQRIKIIPREDPPGTSSNLKIGKGFNKG